jgi:NAD dependent epimerase/dehydratase family enzyme
MADELLLASARVLPGRLEESGYRFRHGGLEAAFRDVLGRAEVRAGNET